MEELQIDKSSGESFELSDFIIKTKRVTKKFGNQFAVKNVSFNVPHGRIFGFVGPSGSGKTTTIRMLTGYYEPSSGEVLVFDQSPTNFSQSTREKIGYLPQLFVLYPNLSVWENLNFAASIYGMDLFRGRKEKLNELLDLVELSHDRKKLARNISGGMQRRLNLAATLIHDPELIFLDEPTAGVDPILRHKFWGYFKSLKETGSTLFITTQYVSEATYCDLVGVINNGVLVAVDSPKGLRYQAYGGDIVELRTSKPIDLETVKQFGNLPFVKGDITRTGENSVRFVVYEARTAIPVLLNWCREWNVAVESIEEYLPPFDDVFVELLRNKVIND